MQSSKGNELDELIRRRLEKALQDACQGEKDVSPEKLETAGRLAQLVEIRERLRPEPAHKRLIFIALFVVTLAIASIIYFTRVPSTLIEFDGLVSGLSFTLAHQRDRHAAAYFLTDGVAVEDLGVSGLAQVRLPRSVPAARSAIRLMAISHEGHAGSINLKGFVLPSETKVTLSHLGEPRKVRLSFSSPQQRLRVIVNGPLVVGMEGTPSQPLTFDTPRSVEMMTGTETVVLDFTLASAPIEGFLRQLPIEDLQLLQVSDDLDQDVAQGDGRVGPVPLRLSAILQGALYFESLHGEERQLRPGERLVFDHSSGEIRTLGIQENCLALLFRGAVAGMATGSGSVMPTWFDYWRAQHGVWLLWGACGYFLTLAIGVLRWLGVRL